MKLMLLLFCLASAAFSQTTLTMKVPTQIINDSVTVTWISTRSGTFGGDKLNFVGVRSVDNRVRTVEALSNDTSISITLGDECYITTNSGAIYWIQIKSIKGREMSLNIAPMSQNASLNEQVKSAMRPPSVMNPDGYVGSVGFFVRGGYTAPERGEGVMNVGGSIVMPTGKAASILLNVDSYSVGSGGGGANVISFNAELRFYTGSH